MSYRVVLIWKSLWSTHCVIKHFTVPETQFTAFPDHHVIIFPELGVDIQKLIKKQICYVEIKPWKAFHNKQLKTKGNITLKIHELQTAMDNYGKTKLPKLH